MANGGIRTAEDGSFAALTFGNTDAVIFDASGITKGAGKRLAQTVEYKTGAYASGSTVFPCAGSIPTNAQGDQYLAVSITPQNINSLLEIEAIMTVSSSASAMYMGAALFQDSIVNALAGDVGYAYASNTPISLRVKHSMLSGTLSPISFKVRAGSNNASTLYVNGGQAGQFLGGVLFSSVTVKEYLP